MRRTQGFSVRRAPSVILTTVMTASVVALLSAQAPTPATQSATASPVDFARDIQPILERSCVSCHSADLKLAELDLSTRDAAMKGGEHGAVIVPGSAERSKLYRMVAGLDEPAMPMQGDPLTKTEITAIQAWIDRGANWDAGIALKAPAAPAPAARPRRPASRPLPDRVFLRVRFSRSCSAPAGTVTARRGRRRNSIYARAKLRCGAERTVLPLFPAMRKEAGCIDSSPVLSRSPCRSSFRSSQPRKSRQ